MAMSPLCRKLYSLSTFKAHFRSKRGKLCFANLISGTFWDKDEEKEEITVCTFANGQHGCKRRFKSSDMLKEHLQSTCSATSLPALSWFAGFCGMLYEEWDAEEQSGILPGMEADKIPDSVKS